MKVTLTKDQALGEFADMEEVHYPETHGYLKRPEDPPIKTLLTWNPEDSPKRRTEVRTSGKWVSEMRDSYRGFFFSEDRRKVFRLKEEDTPSFDPSSLSENSKEKTLTSLKVTARDIPKEESGLIDSSFNDQQPAKVLVAAPVLEPPAAPEPGKPEPPKKPTKRTVPNARAKSAAPREDAEDEERKKRQEERIKKLHQTTRWLPNSAFTTYYGKPAFCAYGQGNIHPTVGGIMYGNYLATHNVSAQEGANDPRYQQVYETAEMYASKRPVKQPEPPRKCKDEDRLTPQQVAEIKQRSQITGKERKKPSRPIVKPDLLKAKTFQSVHSTPNLSRVEDKPAATVAPKTTMTTNTLQTKAATAAPKAAGTVVRHIPTQSDQPATMDTRPRPEQVVRLPADPKEDTPVPVKPDLGEVFRPASEGVQKPVTKDEGIEVHLDRSPETVSPRTIRVQPTPSLIPLSPAPRMEEAPQELREDSRDRYMDENLRNLQYVTAYRDMTAKTGHQPEVPLAEPYRYCEHCQTKYALCRLIPEQAELSPEDMLHPPRNLGEIPVQELNPRNYKFVPSKWTQRIPAAGKLTYRSPSAYQVMFYDPLST